MKEKCDIKIEMLKKLNEKLNKDEQELLTISMWASEPIPFDPMEIAIHDTYQDCCLVDDRTQFKMIHEYALEGKPPMMTHVFENSLGQRIIAAKLKKKEEGSWKSFIQSGLDLLTTNALVNPANIIVILIIAKINKSL